MGISMEGGQECCTEAYGQTRGNPETELKRPSFSYFISLYLCFKFTESFLPGSGTRAELTLFLFRSYGTQILQQNRSTEAELLHWLTPVATVH